MPIMKRRNFLQASLASAITMPTFALEKDNPYRKNIGIQLYTLRNQINKDVKGTLKAVAEAGYRQVEAYGFPDAGPMIQAAKENGLAVHSSHFAWESVTNPRKEGVPDFRMILEKAKDNGLTHLVIPYLHGHERKTLDDYKRVAEKINEAARKADNLGIRLAYHNHAFEFQPLKEARTGYDVFTEEFGPEMFFEVDVFWVKVGGVEPVKLIEEQAGRVTQLHLKDLKAGMKLPNYGGVPDDAFQELGDGIIPMEPIIKAASKAGVVHCHVEQDQSPDPIASINQSLQHLNTL